MSQLNVSDIGGTPQTVGQVNVSTGHTLEIEGTLKFNHRGAHRVPTGTTAERPSVALGPIVENIFMLLSLISII